jgi:hypothetical protein
VALPLALFAPLELIERDACMFTAYRQGGWRERDLAPADLHLVPHPFP